MNPFRSVGARLGIALALVVGGALAIVWVALVPTLERRLVDGRLSELAQSAAALSAEARTTGASQDFVEDAQRTAEARVAYLVPLSGGATTTLSVQADSKHLTPSQDLAHDPIALGASESGKTERGTISRDGTRYAEVAVPDPSGDVLLFSASLRSTLQNVDLVGRRLLWAGLAALAVSLAFGFAAAAAFARRIRRLERAAERIASGDFSQPVVDRSADEVGQLASAFDRMRLQLAQLEGARRAFIANASHELRTPIFSLGGFLELLEDEELDDATRREFFSTMSEQVGRLSKLATDLLDLSRLDAGHLRPEREPVALGELARDLGREFGPRAQRLDHPLDVVIEEDGTVLADRERVLQIGRALVDNALVHTPAKTAVRIVVRGTALVIEDAGPGIPLEDRERVFVRFTRLDGGRAAGTGLGLAIARELAELMGGRLDAVGEPGAAAFTLVLPAGVREREPQLV